MNKFRSFSLFIILVVFGFQAHSQGDISMHLGPSFPLGDFGDDDIRKESSGAAGIGFGIGFNYIYPLTDKGLGLYGGLDIILNPFSKDAKEEVEDIADGPADFTFPKYINIPVSAGLDYTLDANERLSLFGQAGVSLSFLKLTEYIWIEEGKDDYIVTHDVSTSFGFNIGGGVIINDRFEIGLKYLGLGEHELEGEYELGSDTGVIERDLKVSLLMLTLGLRL